MDRPEVWMSAAATPPRLSAAITRLAAWLACRSAADTDPALTWTPMLRVSWSGVPVQVPVPVTVIFPPARDEASSLTGAVLPDGGRLAAEPDCAVPRRKEPIRSAAAATPAAGAR